jgi:hypothetical protein
MPSEATRNGGNTEISSCPRYAIYRLRAILKELNERRHSVTSIFMISSALEIGLVITASAIFLAMVITALALIIWLVAGFVSAAQP